MIATRPGAVRILASDEYVCSRCGILRNCTSSRAKPEHCSDCDSVLRYREPERKPPTQHPTHLTDEECLAARKAFRHGDRSPEVEVAAREYWRRMAIKQRQRAKEAS
jgi:hypothetical protein